MKIKMYMGIDPLDGKMSLIAVCGNFYLVTSVMEDSWKSKDTFAPYKYKWSPLSKRENTKFEFDFTAESMQLLWVYDSDPDVGDSAFGYITGD